MQRYLVTGGAGFIGSTIVETLLKRNIAVRVLDNLATGSLNNIREFLADIEFIKGDIRDLDTVRQATAGVDVVLHQAALPSVPRSVADPLTTHEVNATGTLNLLLAARDSGVKRIVAASSSSVYGNSPTLPKVETMPVEPLSPYAVSKLAAERYCQAFTQVYGLPTISLRYFNVFGPRQDPTSQYSAVIPKFITLMLRGEAPTIHGNGLQSRDFTYVDNVVAANLLAAEASNEISGYFNVACGNQTSLLTLINHINHALGTSISPVFAPVRIGDVKASRADISRASSVLGFNMLVNFKDGLCRTIDYLQSNKL